MRNTFYILIILPLLFSGCNNDDGTHHTSRYERPSVLDKIAEKSVDSAHYDFDMEVLTNFIKTTEALDKDSLLIGHIPIRSADIKSFPCSQCHNVALSKLKSGDKEPQKAHWNIEVQHATSDVMNCQTCHSESSPDKLTTLTGNTLSIDHSYKLCGQCHSPQLEEWQGGAHGKRIGSWATPRVMNTCVNCHDPHSPAFAPRWPARLNTARIALEK